jgi:glycosyltransferase involved in cell wall biosynthesis
VYTEREREELERRMNKPVLAAPNALYTRGQMRVSRPSSGDPSAFLYVGRLIPAKKPDLLLHAFAAVQDELPTATRIVYVGAGPEEQRLRVLAHELGVDRRTVFAGYVEPDALGPFYAEAIASVCPGYVGLSLIQSLAFACR